MRKGTATPERNTSPKLVIPVQTRSPLEAFNLLRMGHPIDRMMGYYADSGILEKDPYMMDTVEKFHALAAYKELSMKHKDDLEEIQRDAAQAAAEAAKAAEVSNQNTNNNGKE